MDYPKVKVCLDTSEDNLIDELYTPCLKWAERFDRGVGYFTTGWLTYNVAGLSDFASRGGKMRLITSPILSTEDTDAIIGAENQDGSAFLRLEAALLENVEILKQIIRNTIQQRRGAAKAAPLAISGGCGGISQFQSRRALGVCRGRRFSYRPPFPRHP